MQAACSTIIYKGHEETTREGRIRGIRLYCEGSSAAKMSQHHAIAKRKDIILARME